MAGTALREKVVLVTGGNHGIGAATARACAAAGAAVFITYLRLAPEEYGVIAEEAAHAMTPGRPFYHAQQTRTADAVVATIQAEGGRAAAYEADLADLTSVPTLFDRAEAAFGPVSILINNAAYCQRPPDTIFLTTADSIDRHFAINTRAVLLLTAEFVRRHQARGARWGRILNISTDAAQHFAGQISYGASKAATEAYTRSVAIEVGPLGITVNTVAPGPVQTGYITAESEASLLPTIPLQRLGTPEDIADVLVFLASDHARWLTGQVIKVSGGHEI
jgi:3-oxoacyl-[acyl-carrier protein] reductase